MGNLPNCPRGELPLHRGEDGNHEHGVMIQGASINRNGDFSPAASENLPAGSSQIECYVPPLSAVLIQTA